MMINLSLIFKVKKHEDNASNDTIEVLESHNEVESPTSIDMPCQENRSRHESNDTIEVLENHNEVESPTSSDIPCRENRRRQRHSVIEPGTHLSAREVNRRLRICSVTDTRPPQFTRKLSTAHSTKLKIRTDKTAKVLVSIVILFMVTHCYRIALKIYESSFPSTSNIDSFKICFNLKRYVLL